METKEQFFLIYLFTFTSAKNEWGLRNSNFLTVSPAALSGDAGADSILLSCGALGKMKFPGYPFYFIHR